MPLIRPLRVLFRSLAFLCLLLGASNFRASEAIHTRIHSSMTVEERVEAQRKIERVYYEHRIWPEDNPGPKPSFEEMVPQEVILWKVDDSLRKTSALRVYWGKPITGEQLQAEMERMARDTKRPALLKALWAALGNDPYLIAECLARPVLADRLLSNWFGSDERVHGDLKARVRAEVDRPP